MKIKINETEDGFCNWMVVTEPDPITDMHCVQFLTTWSKSTSPEPQVKHSMFVSRRQLDVMIASLNSCASSMGNYL